MMRILGFSCHMQVSKIILFFTLKTVLVLKGKRNVIRSFRQGKREDRMMPLSELLVSA